jgi:hypothetical protein
VLENDMNSHARRRTAALGLLVIGIAASLSACDVFGPRGDVLRDQLRRSEDRWNAAGAPTTYTMTVLQVTDADPDPEAVLLDVVGGVIVAGVTVEDGVPLSSAVLANYRTVPALFGLIREALDKRAPAIAVNYHDDYGYPTELFIDFNQNTTSDDIYVAVTALSFDG